MDSTIIAAIIGAVAGIVAIVAGSFLGTHLTKQASIATAKELAALEQRKLIRDRLWDHQRDAYTAMISSVRSLWSQAANLANAFDRGDTGGGYEDATDQFWKDWTETSKQFHAGRLIFSDKFHDRYDALITTVANGRTNYQGGDNYYEWIRVLFGDVFTDLVDIARRDIGADLPPA